MVQCSGAFRGSKAAMVYQDSGGVLKYVRKGPMQGTVLHHSVLVERKIGEYSERYSSYSEAKLHVNEILDLFGFESPEVANTPELSPEELQQGDIITVECKDGSVKTGCVVDRRGFKHEKVVILQVSEGYYTSWATYPMRSPILKIQSRLGHVPSGGYSSDDDARKLLKDFLSKSPPKKREFKVGEKVRVVKAGDGGHSVGTIGIIVKAKSSRSLEVEANKKVYWHNHKSITLFRG